MDTPIGFEISDPLLTVEQAAEYTNTSIRFMRRLVFESRIDVVRVGRHVRFRRSALDAFLIASTTPGRAS